MYFALNVMNVLCVKRRQTRQGNRESFSFFKTTCLWSLIWKMWLMNFLPRLQPIVILILFIAFLWIFGINAYQKYRSYEVYIKETVVEYPEGLEAPAMTICVDAVRGEREIDKNFSKRFLRDLPSMPEGRMLQLTEETGCLGLKEKLFAT